MATLKEELKSGTLSRVAADEPIFVLRAKDAVAPEVVRTWCIMARLVGTPAKEVHDAASVAQAMEAWKALVDGKLGGE